MNATYTNGASGGIVENVIGAIRRAFFFLLAPFRVDGTQREAQETKAPEPQGARIKTKVAPRRGKPIEDDATVGNLVYEDYWPKIKQDAENCLGVKYRYGKEVDLFGAFPPDSLDCSEFIELIFNRSGIPCPDGAFAQFAASYIAPVPRPGDLYFFRKKSKEASWNPCGIYHVVMLLSSHGVIEARGRPVGKVCITTRREIERREDFKATGGWRRLRVLRGS